MFESPRVHLAGTEEGRELFYTPRVHANREGSRPSSALTATELNLNFVWAYLYITDAPEGHVSKVWFDDNVVATEYIGPIKK